VAVLKFDYVVICNNICNVAPLLVAARRAYTIGDCCVCLSVVKLFSIRYSSYSLSDMSVDMSF